MLNCKNLKSLYLTFLMHRKWKLLLDNDARFHKEMLSCERKWTFKNSFKELLVTNNIFAQLRTIHLKMKLNLKKQFCNLILLLFRWCIFLFLPPLKRLFLIYLYTRYTLTLCAFYKSVISGNEPPSVILRTVKCLPEMAVLY